MDPTLYHQLIGSLIYLVNTRPDFCFVANTLSQYQGEPRIVLFTVANNVLSYLHGTMDNELDYVRGDGFDLVGYTYSDWVGNVVDPNRTFNFCLNLGSVYVS